MQQQRARCSTMNNYALRQLCRDTVREGEKDEYIAYDKKRTGECEPRMARPIICWLYVPDGSSVIASERELCKVESLGTLHSFLFWICRCYHRVVVSSTKRKSSSSSSTTRSLEFRYEHIEALPSPIHMLQLETFKTAFFIMFMQFVIHIEQSPTHQEEIPYKELILRNSNTSMSSCLSFNIPEM